MNNLKKFLFSYLITFIILFIFIIFINIFYYFNMLNENIYHFIKLIILVCSIFIGSFNLGTKSNYKGFIDGFIFGLIIICVLFIISLLFSNIQLKLVLYYLVILSSSTLGGTIGIRKKKKV